MPRNIAPKAKFNLFLKSGTERAYLYLFLHYMKDGVERTRYKKTVPNTKVKPEFWDKTRQRLKVDRSDPTFHIKVNAFLDELAAHVEAIFRDFENGRCTPEQIDTELGYRMGWVARPLPPEKRPTPSLWEFVPAFIEQKKGQPRGTWKVLQTGWNHLQQFAEERFRRPLTYDEIDRDFAEAFKQWLFSAPRNLSINYVEKVFSVLRQFMREALQRKFHQNRDYEFFRIKKVKISKLALTFEELQKLYALDLSAEPGMERARDLFLIGAYTGLRFSDFTRILPEHIEEIQGKKLITITNQKTNITVSIPLFPIPETLLRKYNFKAPTLTNQVLNRYLKEIGKRAGLTDRVFQTDTAGGTRTDKVVEKWEQLSSHVARRSFATNFFRDGVQASVLMKITGHSTERQFMQYIQIDGRMNALHFAELREGKPEQNHLKVAS